MTQYITDDLRIKSITEVDPPKVLHARFPLNDEAARTVTETRKQIHNILHGQDDRLLVVIGPCSIHDPEAAREYAQRLKKQIHQYQEDLLIIMRVYF